jgi:hypothetical protein
LNWRILREIRNAIAIFQRRWHLQIHIRHFAPLTVVLLLCHHFLQNLQSLPLEIVEIGEIVEQQLHIQHI